jgi:hypothetical protein
LGNNKWKLTPNFHFSYRASGLLWVKGDIPLNEYLIYWKGIIKGNRLNQIKKEDWEEYLKTLLSKRIMSENDRSEFNKKFSGKGYPKLNTCPGVEMSYTWDKNTAIDMDDKDKFCEEVSKRIQEALKCWT